MNDKLAAVRGAHEALRFLNDAYRTRLVRPGRTTEHPITVGRLLADDGQSPRLVIAGLLHDALEDTGAKPGELCEKFGGEITRLVAALTEDRSISQYRARKAALRGQILDAGPDAATISLADKLAKLQGVTSRPKKRKLEHYRLTLNEVEQRYGPSRLSVLLRAQLYRW